MDQHKSAQATARTGADTARIIVLGLAVLVIAAGVVSLIAAG